MKSLRGYPHHFQAILYKDLRSEARLDPTGIDLGYPPWNQPPVLLRSLLHAAGGGDCNLVHFVVSEGQNGKPRWCLLGGGLVWVIVLQDPG